MFKDFKTMINAQEELNNKFVHNWRESVSLEQQISAVQTELAEWFESAPRSGGVVTNGVFGWKWWKRNLSDDNQNKRIEVIDVWHFMMSTWLLLGNKETISHFINEFTPIENDFSNLQNIHRTFASYVVFCFEKELENAIFTGMNLIHYLMLETDGMNWEDLEIGYFLKNKLNHTRVKGGYQDGNYQKHDENGQEDNRKLKV